MQNSPSSSVANLEIWYTLNEKAYLNSFGCLGEEL
jgi:hypothetical protein